MTETPDQTAVRVALWRALHVEQDAPPPVLNDTIGLQLVAPDAAWRSRPDMHIENTRLFRASIVARSRFIEDVVEDYAQRGVRQYVLLGAGLDSFVQRRPELASRLTVFEVDQPETQAWKQQRLLELGYGVPDGLRFVPVNFEAAWWEQMAAAGFDAMQPAVVASMGVSMYLTQEAIVTTLQQMAKLAPGSVFAMSFLVPIDQASADVRIGLEFAAKGAQANGTPFRSFFAPEDMLALARKAGFKEAEHISGAMLAARYFAGRPDGLRPPDRGEEILLART